jgi:hypothetical protein
MKKLFEDLLKIFRRKSFDSNLFKIFSSKNLHNVRSRSSEDLKNDLGLGYCKFWYARHTVQIIVAEGYHLDHFYMESLFKKILLRKIVYFCYL